MAKLDYQTLQAAVKNGAAFRCRTKLQPAGGEGDKVFPPTYADARYATEYRRLPQYDDPVFCVLMDSVQSQANRIEEALQDAIDDGQINLPVVEVDFSDLPIVEPGSGEAGLFEPIGRVSSLEAPHRIADAILRDSELDGVTFRDSKIGKQIGLTTARNATPLLQYNPTALVLGLWDSTGPKGGLGVKFQRALVSEIIGVNASLGVKTSSRIDPLSIQKSAGVLYETPGNSWTLNKDEARQENKKPVFLGKDGRPSEANHGNIVPSLSDTGRDPFHPERRVYLAGGVTIDYAEQSIVLSLPALRRLKFPVDAGGKSDPGQNLAAQTALAALGLCGAALSAQRGMDLRSRCLLWPSEAPSWELLGAPGDDARTFQLDANSAIELLNESVKHLQSSGLPWQSEPVVLKPSSKLIELIRKSQELAVTQSSDGGE